MSYYGSWKIDDTLTFTVNTHSASTGAATDADSAPAYRVYEDETATPILTGTMALLDDANTTGFYSEQIALSAANGFEKGKSYNIYISAAVGGVTGTVSHTFQMEAEVDANVVSDKAGYSISGTKTTLDALNDLSAAEVNTEVDTALVDIHLDHLLAADYDPTAKPGIATALLNELVENDGGVSRFTINALEQVWQAAARILTASTNFNDLSTADIDARLAAIGLDHLLGAAVVGADVADNSILARLVSASATADWDDFVNTTDSLQALRDRGDAAWITAVGFSTLTAADVNTEVDNALNTAVPVTPVAGSINERIKSLDELLESGGGGDAAAILADTNELQGDWVDGGRLDLILDARASQTTADAIETDTQDIQSRLPVALVGGKMDADATAISGSTDAADKLEASAETMATGAAIAGTLSTTQMTTDLTEATDDHYIGRAVIWTSGVLKDQASDITDYAGATKMLTFTAVTEAPSATDTFVIV